MFSTVDIVYKRVLAYSHEHIKPSQLHFFLSARGRGFLDGFFTLFRVWQPIQEVTVMSSDTLFATLFIIALSAALLTLPYVVYTDHIEAMYSLEHNICLDD